MRLVATREVRYANRTYLPGDTFEATDSHAKVLKAIKKAADAPVEPPVPTQVRALVAEEPAPIAPPRRGRYGRRDMRADEGDQVVEPAVERADLPAAAAEPSE